MHRDSKPKVLLIQPPVYDFALYDLFFKPYGLLRIGRWLADSGWKVEYLDGLDYREPETVAALGAPRRRADGTGKLPKREVPKPAPLAEIPRRYSRYGILPEVLERRIARSGADLVLVTSQMTYWYPGVAETAAAVRRALPGAALCVGGVYATLLPEHCRRVTEADEVAAGTAEEALPACLRRLGLPEPSAPFSGRPLMRPGVWEDAGVLRLNRGCPYSCEYCASSLIEPGFTSGDPEEAYLTAERMHREYGTRNFAFYDDALLVNRHRSLLPFLELVMRAEMQLAFYTPNAVHLSGLDRETARMMARAGFREVRLGYESADADFHLRRDRKYSADEVAPAIETLREAGFRGEEIILYVLAGVPGQDPAELEETIRAAAGFGVRAAVAEYSPVPGTPMWEESVRLSRYDLAGEPLYHNNTVFPMERSGFDRTELERLKQLSRVLCAGQVL
jgi:radical SAM superfamily enzyme YgiQ (UPF0313 family)